MVFAEAVIPPKVPGGMGTFTDDVHLTPAGYRYLVDDLAKAVDLALPR